MAGQLRKTPVPLPPHFISVCQLRLAGRGLGDIIKTCPMPTREDTGRGSQGEKKQASRVSILSRGEWKESDAVPSWEDLEESSNLPGKGQQEDPELLMSQWNSKEHMPS